MGFLSNIFKKKKGGTFVGNLLRGASSSVTGGILGSGAGLAKWEAEQAQKEQDAYYQQLSKQQIDARQLGQDLVNKVAVPNMAGGGANQPNIGQNVFMETVKQKWYWFVAAAAGIFGGAYLIAKNGGKNKRVK